MQFAPGSGAPAPGSAVLELVAASAPGAAIGTKPFQVHADPVGLAEHLAFGSIDHSAMVANGGSFNENFGPTDLFSFKQRSLDTFNSFTLRFTDGTLQLFSGGQIINDPALNSGDQTSTETNGTVSYRITSGR